MRKLLLCLFFSTVMVAARAQQLPNYGFNNWKASCASTEAFNKNGSSMRQRPGVEPTDWNGSSVNQEVSGMTKSETLVFNDGNAVKMVNKFVGVKIIWTIGSVAPGFVTLGTPWVYAVADVDKCDGGVYGGVNFTYKPDAITGRYKRTDATGEKSHIIAYLWNGTYTSKVGSKSSPSYSRDNVARAIMGKTTPTASGTLVASCDYEFTATTNQDWQTITVPLKYVVDAGVNPTMMNTIISGGDYWDRSVMKENTTLYADDVRFVYYSTLKTLSYNGSALSVPEAGATLDMSSVVYDPTKLAYTLNGQTATAITSYDENNSVLTITVSNVDNDIDGQSSHTYYIQFAHVHGAFKYTTNGAGITVTCGRCGESMGTVSMVVPSDLIYDGKAKAISLNGSIEEMDNPVIVYSSGTAPINAGAYSASITLGDATATVNYTIKAKDIEDATIGSFATMTYTGSAQTPVATVTLDGFGKVTGTWSAVTNVSDKTTFTADGNYTGSISNVACGMKAKDVTGATVGAFTEMTYTGSAQTPVATVTLDGFGKVTGTWSAVTNVFDVSTFTANGNYTGTISDVDCGMQPKSIDGALVGAFAAMTYTGEEQTPVATVTLDGFGKVAGTWSTVTNVSDASTFTAQGNYAGQIANVDCGMQPKNIDGAVVGEFVEMIYTGEPQIPSAMVTLEGYGEVTGTWSEVVNVDDKAVFTANGNFDGVLKAHSGMTPLAITVVSAAVEDVAFDAEGNYTLVVTDVVFADAELNSGIDYTTDAQLVGENIEGATSEVLITFSMLNTNYVFVANTLSATVTLLQHEHEWEYTTDGTTIWATCKDSEANCPSKTANITLQAPLDAIYSGAPKRVMLTGNYPGLSQLEEYVTYTGDCTNVGTHSATITYGGVVATIEFVITPKDITDEAIVGEFVPMTYNGKAQMPSAIVTLENYGEVSGAWSEVLHVGDVTTFVATGNYTGSICVQSGMSPLELTEPEVDGILESYEYTGAPIEPVLTLMSAGIVLAENVDYVVTYRDNVEIGEGCVFITFIGDYSGDLTMMFKIIDTSSIDAVLNREEKVYYDLYGRRILEPVKGELYIVNGKKVRW